MSPTGRRTPRTPTQPAQRPARVLIVEDETAQARALQALLEFEGHDVRTCDDGASALEVARQGCEICSQPFGFGIADVERHAFITCCFVYTMYHSLAFDAPQNDDAPG